MVTKFDWEDLTTPINMLQLGQDFVFRTWFNYYDREHAIGTLVDIGVGHVTVEFVTDTYGRDRTSWQPLVPVIPIDSTTDYTNFVPKEDVMATPNPKFGNLMQRFKFLTNQLVNPETKPEAIDTAVQRLTALKAEAEAAGLAFNQPENFDKLMENEHFFVLFADYTFGTGAKSKPTKAQKEDAKNAEVASAISESKQVDLAKAQAKGTPKEKKVKEPKFCLDGCGQQTKGGSFIAGHDAKLKSILLKVERGEEEPTTIPEIALPFCEFTEDGKTEVVVIKGKDGAPDTTTGGNPTYYFSKSPVKLPNRRPVAAA